MKKILSLLLAGVVAIGVGACGSDTEKSTDGSRSESPSSESPTWEPPGGVSLGFDSSLCEQIPASVAEGALGVPVTSTETMSDQMTKVCQYPLSADQFVALRLNRLDFENQKLGQEALDRTITTSDLIPMEHFVAVQEDGLINEIVLKIEDQLILAVDRSSTDAADEEQFVAFAGAVAAYLQSGGSSGDAESSPSTSSSAVPDPQEEDVVRNFFQLIEEGLVSDAVLAMSSRNTKDDATKQAWGVYFNAMTSVTVLGVKPSLPEYWTEANHTYEVTLDVVMDPDSADATIPYFGYEDGKTTRFISLLKEDGLWKIDAIGTGP